MEVCLNMYDLLLLLGTKGLREQNICVKQKIAKLKFVYWTSKTERIVKFKIANEQIFIAFTYLFMDFYFGIKSHEIKHTFKTYD